MFYTLSFHVANSVAPDAPNIIEVSELPCWLSIKASGDIEHKRLAQFE